ncbi:MAG TPA: phosphatidate cytidylyltransferase [Caldilineaceae bacterium]|nr:phosphatidate cytidylyltransferase [Caldilineaceae bacterium]
MIALAQRLQIDANLLIIFVEVVTLLALTTIGYGVLRQRLVPVRSLENLPKIGSRISFLWMMTFFFTLGLFISPKILILYIWFIAFLALKEFFSMTPSRRADRRVLFVAYLSLPIQFIFILLGWQHAFTAFVPIWVFLVLPMVMVIIGETRGFLRAWSTLGWGIITTVYSLGFLAYLLMLKDAVHSRAGSIGLFLFLMAMAQLSHTTQYIFGRIFTSPRLSLKVSQTRNWASLLGSIVISALVGWFWAPQLTIYDGFLAIGISVVIAVGAFVGYIILSAIKHDLQIRDRGTMTPGQGGVLNRIDTFVYTAPLFYYLTIQLFAFFQRSTGFVH